MFKIAMLGLAVWMLTAITLLIESIMFLCFDVKMVISTVYTTMQVGGYSGFVFLLVGTAGYYIKNYLDNDKVYG